MHEFSIVSSLLENCERLAKENQAKEVLVVELEIGERSGVEQVLLERAFEDFKIGSVCEKAELKIQKVPVVLFCEDCKEENPAQEINYTQCPHCKGDRVRIIKGREMLLKRLEME